MEKTAFIRKHLWTDGYYPFKGLGGDLREKNLIMLFLAQRKNVHQREGD